MLRQRVITALILAPLVLAAILFLPDSSFNLIAIAIFALGAWEWGGLASLSQPGRIFYVVVFTVVSFVLYRADQQVWQSVLWFSMVVWLCALFWVVRFPAAIHFWGGRFQRALLGMVLLVPAWLAIVYLKQTSLGGVLIVMLMLIIWGADIGAYFSGRAWGKTKLAPQVSPGKTWAGVLGGLFSSVVICWALASAAGLMSYLQPLQWLSFGVLALATASISVLGDLTVSMLKRHRGVKDSGNLLPGHGGLLDRIDSLVAGLPLFSLLIAKMGLA